MRVLHVVPTYWPAERYGGPIRTVHGLASAMARRGHEVSVFTTNVDGAGISDVPLGRPVELDGVAVTYFPTGLGRRLYRSPVMGRALLHGIGGYDVVHVHSVFLWPTTTAARCARAQGVPYVISPRGMLVGDLIRRKSRLAKTAWLGLFDRRNIAGAAAVHLTSDIERDEFLKLGFDAARLSVIPNGVELPDADDAAPMRKPDAQPIVLTLGRISWKKGLDRLIRAMAHVEGARLVIAGNDEEGLRPRLEAIAREVGVADRVEFAGPVAGSGKWRLLRSADVFALPSLSESFGVAVLEAMAMGLPVVVTPEVGLAPSVAAAGAGLVAAGEPDVFGAALARLCNAPAEREAMGRAGAWAAHTTFSWAAVASGMEALYGDIAVVGRKPVAVHA